VLRRLAGAFLLATTGLGHAALAEAPARAWLLKLDNRVIETHQADLALPPASLTKIMTAMLWLQKPLRQQEWVTVSARAAAETGTRLGLKAGQRYRGAELLAAMLVTSANDACVALAEHSAGSVQAFVRDMNKAAQVLGLAQTHFDNPCGHDAVGQRSSANDLLRLTEIALADPVFKDLVARPTWAFPRGAGTASGAREVLKSSNLLFGRLAGAQGVKTGFTAQAGKCVIALAERDGHRVLLVLLNAPDRWWAAHGLIESAFARAGNAPR
jgi:D-alanyl-D-alanine carboxypeptidase (penicillin-binding protein 5/6)